MLIVIANMEVNKGKGPDMDMDPDHTLFRFMKGLIARFPTALSPNRCIV